MRQQYKYKLLASIGLLSASIIAFQLALMQILSITQWYHFAYMIISVALLGFGAAGTVLAIWKNELLAHFDHILPVLVIMCGVGMPIVVEASQGSFARFDTYLIFVDYKYLWKLVFTYLLFFAPFFLGALAIGMIFVKFVSEIGKIYFANLVGSGVGGMAALFLLNHYLPSQTPAIVGTFSLLAGTILIPKRRLFIHSLVGITGIALLVWKIIDPPRLTMSQYKDLSKTMLLPQAKLVLERPGIYGFAQLVTAPALRYAPGLSLTAQVTAKSKMAAFVNGDWFGAITEIPKRDSAFILDYTSFALPYVMSAKKSVLVLKAGGGIDVIHAYSKGAEKIIAVEPNSTMFSAILRQYDTEPDSNFHRKGIQIHFMEPRTFLMMDNSKYDLIALPVTGSFGGSSGLFALQEQFILTKEAFKEMWFKLNPGGAISISSWMDYPSRNPLRILATMAELLEDVGIQNRQAHIAAIRSWSTISFVLTKSPIQKYQEQNIRNFCEQMQFDPALLPNLDSLEREKYNQLGDKNFFLGIDQILSFSRNEMYHNYEFNIRPTTDNRPYFSQFLKWRSIGRLSNVFGTRSIPFFEVGYLLLLVTLIQVILISFLLIILPLLRAGVKTQRLIPVFLYFGGIGLGYMFIEIVLIQSFTLYLGNPAYAASAVISILLISSGAGSYVSNRFNNSNRLLIIFASIVFALALYSFVLTFILQTTIHFSWLLKLILILLLISPVGFLLGIPFPAGLSRISSSISTVSWAWGLNGCISVISTALATIVSIEMGHNWVILFAALAYTIPLVTTFVYFKKEILL